MRASQILAAQIRVLRTDRGWSQAALAERMTAAGFPMLQTTVAKIETMNRAVTTDELTGFASVFEVEIPDMLDFAGCRHVSDGMARESQSDPRLDECSKGIELSERERAEQAICDAIQAYVDLNRAEAVEPSAMLTGWLVMAASSPDLRNTIYTAICPTSQPAHASIGLAQLLVDYSDDFV